MTRQPGRLRGLWNRIVGGTNSDPPDRPWFDPGRIESAVKISLGWFAWSVNAADGLWRIGAWLFGPEQSPGLDFRTTWPFSSEMVRHGVAFVFLVFLLVCYVALKIKEMASMYLEMAPWFISTGLGSRLLREDWPSLLFFAVAALFACIFLICVDAILGLIKWFLS